MFFIFRLLINALVIFFVSHAFDSITLRDGVFAPILFAFVLGVINSVIRPILIILTFPITVLTLGIFTLVINSFTFWLASLLSYGIHIESFAAAFWGGGIVWLFSYFTNLFLIKEEHYR